MFISGSGRGGRPWRDNPSSPKPTPRHFGSLDLSYTELEYRRIARFLTAPTGSEAVTGQGPLNKHLDTDHLDFPPVCESAAIIPPGHGALLVVLDEHTQQHPRWEAEKLSEIDRTFGVTSTTEDATLQSTK